MVKRKWPQEGSMIAANDLVSGLETISSTLISGILIAGLCLVGLACIGKKNQNIRGKLKQRGEKFIRGSSKKLAKKALKEEDDDTLELAANVYAESYLRSFSRDVERGAKVITKAVLGPEKKPKHKLT